MQWDWCLVRAWVCRLRHSQSISLNAKSIEPKPADPCQHFRDTAWEPRRRAEEALADRRLMRLFGNGRPSLVSPREWPLRFLLAHVCHLLDKVILVSCLCSIFSRGRGLEFCTDKVIFSLPRCY